jgi:hypothetical protein
MYRRTLLRTLGAGFGTVFAGCSRSRVNGVVSSNETPLVLTHEYATQATSSGTRVLVEVVAENVGNEQITTDSQVPKITCTFLDDTGDTLHQSGRELVQPLDVGASTLFEFPLTIDTADVTRYELRSEWIETEADNALSTLQV